MAHGLSPLAAPLLPNSTLFTNAPALHDLRIELEPAATASLRRDPRRYVAAHLIADGVALPNVGVHLKGSIGSFRPLDDRPSLTLDLERFQGGRTFQGTTKLHLNNAAEDPSLLSEWLGTELFRQAGIPSPDVTHARVTLNGRRLGLYVVKEGFTREFLGRTLGRTDGTLWEAYSGNDVDGHLKRSLGPDTPGGEDSPVAIVRTLSENDPAKRWQQLASALDRDSFATFLALEVILNHRDGYALARNNFRLWIDPTSHRARFLPHGMDQLFTQPEARWNPHMAGAVARAWMEIPEGRQAFEERVRELTPRLLAPTNAIELLLDRSRRLRAALTTTEARRLDRETREFIHRIGARAESLKRQLDTPPPALLGFHRGMATIAGWTPSDPGAVAELREVADPPHGRWLHIRSTKPGVSAWVATVQLPAGIYRLEARARTSSVVPLPFGRHQGACLRVIGTGARSISLVKSRELTPLSAEITVSPGNAGTPVTFACELRASSGEAWFEPPILRALR